MLYELSAKAVKIETDLIQKFSCEKDTKPNRAKIQYELGNIRNALINEGEDEMRDIDKFMNRLARRLYIP